MMSWADCADDDDEVGHLTIDGVDMFTAAWRVENLIELWQAAEQRGEDSIRPGIDGAKPRKRRKAVTARSLQLRIFGTVDKDGVLAPNNYIGLQENIDYLIANVVDPPNVANSVRTAVLTMPNGDTRSALIHVTGMQIGEWKARATHCLAVLTISIPEGQIT